MPHPIYGPAAHRLQRVEIKLTLPSETNGGQTHLLVTGECETRRTSLWSETMLWTPASVTDDQGVRDVISHIVSRAWEYRPSSQEQYTKVTSSTNFDQDVLF